MPYERESEEEGWGERRALIDGKGVMVRGSGHWRLGLGLGRV